jgi:predicted sugar kinase
MYFELGVPAVLLLGIVALEDEGQRTLSLMGAALQHPPSHIFAFHSDAFVFSGSRAKDAYPYVEQFIEHHNIDPAVEIEIELAAPKYMGLGPAPLIGLGAVQALAWANDLPADDIQTLAQAIDMLPQYALEKWAYDRGGLLFVELPGSAEGAPRVLRRDTIEHADKAADWVIVFHLPRVPEGTPEDLSYTRRAELLDAAQHLDGDKLAQAAKKLTAAVEADELEAFAAALGDIIAINRAALAANGTPYPEPSEEDERILRLMRDHGAALAAQTPAGLGNFCLVRGAEPSLALRKHLRSELGYAGGIILATIVDNTGARYIIQNKPKYMRHLEL